MDIKEVEVSLLSFVSNKRERRRWTRAHLSALLLSRLELTHSSISLASVLLQPGLYILTTSFSHLHLLTLSHPSGRTTISTTLFPRSSSSSSGLLSRFFRSSPSTPSTPSGSSSTQHSSSDHPPISIALAPLSQEIFVLTTPNLQRWRLASNSRTPFLVSEHNILEQISGLLGGGEGGESGLDVSLELHGVEVMDEEKGEIAVLISYVDERRWKAGFGDERGGKVGEERSFAVGVVRFGGSGEMEVGRLVGCEFKMVSRVFLVFSSFFLSLQRFRFRPWTREIRVDPSVTSGADPISSLPTRSSEHRPSSSSSPFLHHPSFLQHRFHHPPILYSRPLSFDYRIALRGSHHPQGPSEERVLGDRIEQRADDEREDRGGCDYEGEWSTECWSEAEGCLGRCRRVSFSFDTSSTSEDEREQVGSLTVVLRLSFFQSCIDSNRSTEVQD